LNGCERVQRDQEQTEVDGILRADGRMERHSSLWRAGMEACEPGMRGVLAEEDKGSACAPKHAQRPRMWIEFHAAH
jgi:hypothetical protein